MKIPCLLLLISLSALCASAAVVTTQQAADVKSLVSSDYTIKERGPNHLVMERTVAETNEIGEVRTRTASYTSLETSMHYQNEKGEWVPSKEEIELHADGAIARQGRHQVTFSANGDIDLLTPDNKRMRSRVLCLSYFDQATGQSVRIADVKESVTGQLLPPNQVVYEDVTTDFHCDLRYSYTKAGLEQDLLIRTQPPPCTDWGMDPKTTVLLLLTELVEWPGAPDLDFGEMKIGRGKAFSVPDAGQDSESVPVRRRVQNLDERDFLIEEVDVEAIDRQLKALPVAQEAALRQHGRGVGELSARLLVPPAPAAQRSDQTMQMAKAEFNRRAGFTIDYIILSQSTLLLKSDSTYLVMGPVYLAHLTNEAACVKFTNSAAARIHVNGTMTCLTGPFRPGIYSSWKDDTVGEKISQSDGVLPPTGTFHGNGLSINTSGQTVKDLRFSYTSNSVTLGFGAGQINLANLQFVKCKYPIDSYDNDENLIIADNCLFYSSTYAMRCGRDMVVYGQQLTANQASYFAWSKNQGDSYAFLTNCLLLAVASLGSDFEFTTPGTVYSSTDPGNIFQAVGAASHYLANDTYRGIGEPITPALMADLKQKTTRPPEILNAISLDTVLGPREIRDSFTGGQGDLGFHYSVIDYVANALALANTLLLTNGVALATYGASTSYGISIGTGGKVISEGLPTRLNRIVRYNTVQEQATSTWSSSTVGPSIKIGSGTGQTVQFRFTAWSLPAKIGYHFFGSIGSSVGFRDCQFAGGSFYASDVPCGITNCLWDRVAAEAGGSTGKPFHMYNNLARGGGWTWTTYDTGWVVRDNVFDACTLDVVELEVINDHNAYVNIPALPNSGGSDKPLTIAVYTPGPLGSNYYSTTAGQLGTLLDAGSREPAQAGLFHYTIFNTNPQTKDALPKVEIGFHYVAVNTSNQPLDTDGDGLPDHAEDKDGDNVLDAGETNWQSYDSPNQLVSGTGLVVFTPLK